MRIYRNISEIDNTKKSVVTVGTFDGFHLGHQSILEQIKQIAADNGLKSTIVTFDPHPRKVLGNSNGGISILTTLEEKSLGCICKTGSATITEVVMTRMSKAILLYSAITAARGR